MGQTIHGLKQESKGETRDWTVIDRGDETVGPLRVGCEPSPGVKMVDKQLECQFSSSVKGKRDLARCRATKWISKADTKGVGKHGPSTMAIWNSQGKNGDGKCSNEPFQFSASGRTEMGFQSQRQECGDSIDGYGGDQSEANANDAIDQSKDNVRDRG